MKRLAMIAVGVFVVTSVLPAAELDKQALRQAAMRESCTPVHPGSPGRVPFWNKYSKRFMYAPAFDFQVVEGARKYRFQVVSETDGKRHVFESAHPWNSLGPIWADLAVGFAKLTVDGLDAQGAIVGQAGTRRFYRAAVWHGPYRRAVRDYRTSALMALEHLFRQKYVQSWRTTGKPNPSYELYCYPSKMVAAIIKGMLRWSKSAPPAEARRATEIARRAAEYLISISASEGSPYEYFPPTYAGKKLTAGRFAGQIMLIYPAVAGAAYLDLYDAVHDDHFLQAARRIADTYVKTQLPSGTWPLKIVASSGKPVVPNLCVPVRILKLLERLATDYGEAEYKEPARRAWQWIEQNPLRTYNWDGQFEDVFPCAPYQNLARGDASAVVILLFDRGRHDPKAIAKAEELLHFIEDQFVVWEKPMPNQWNDGGKRWVTPCALEQYRFHTAIDASAATAIAAFHKAYEVTHKPLYLAKARSLANTMTVVQDPNTGHYPTYWYVKPVGHYWLNCEVFDAMVMLDFATIDKVR